ncbi:MAG: hypothetical protein LBV39_04075 [Bacteroidales bacterium]|jgi:hypothetical protein|nr:hypothetical protein [Bacteroidales bacterium]
MTKLLGKCTLIGSISLAVLLTVVSIVPRWSEGLLQLLQYLFGNSDDCIVVYPLLLTLLGSLLVFVAIGLVVWFVVRAKDNGQAKTDKRKTFFFYYLLTFSATGLLLFIGSTALFNPFTSYVFKYVDELLTATYCGCVILALLEAALLMSIVKMWKTNTVVSIILACILVAFLVTTFIPIVVISDSIYHSCGNSSYYDDEIMDIEDIDEVEADEVEAVAVPDEEPCDLWSESNDCADNIESALKFVIHYYSKYTDLSVWNLWDDQDIASYQYKYYWDTREEYNGYRNLPPFVQFLKNHNTQLSKLFKTYGYLLFKTVPRDLYWNSAASRLVTLVNHTYDELYVHGNGDQTCERIYDVMENNNLAFYDYFARLKPICIRDEALHYFYDEDDDVDKSIAVWAYSFWGRRYHEGNAVATHQILLKIAEHYNRPE